MDYTEFKSRIRQIQTFYVIIATHGGVAPAKVDRHAFGQIATMTGLAVTIDDVSSVAILSPATVACEGIQIL